MESRGSCYWCKKEIDMEEFPFTKFSEYIRSNFNENGHMVSISKVRDECKECSNKREYNEIEVIRKIHGARKILEHNMRWKQEHPGVRTGTHVSHWRGIINGLDRLRSDYARKLFFGSSAITGSIMIAATFPW